MNDDANKIVAIRRLSNNKTITSKSFKYKTKIIEGKAANSRVLNTKVVIPQIYLINFLRSLDCPLINFEIQLDLTWSEDCVIYIYIYILDNAEIPTDSASNPSIAHLQEETTNDATFEITNTKFYVGGHFVYI